VGDGFLYIVAILNLKKAWFVFVIPIVG